MNDISKYLCRNLIYSHILAILLVSGTGGLGNLDLHTMVNAYDYLIGTYFYRMYSSHAKYLALNI